MPTFQAIHLGDAVSGDVDNLSDRLAFVNSGQGWGDGQTDPLSDLSLVEIEYTTTSPSGSIRTNGSYDSSISYDVPGGTTGAQDITGLVNLLFDITTVDDFGVETTHPNIHMVLFHGADGQDFLIPYWGTVGSSDYYSNIGDDQVTSIVVSGEISVFASMQPPSNTWADTGFPPTPDGTVDGEDTGEVMDLGYDDSTGATHGGGDIITSGDNVIEGNGGDDTITTGAGSDMIDGGTGHDSISGGAGNDTIIGGAGSDTILLGDGYLGDSITGGEDVGDGDIDVIDASGVTNDGIDVVLSGSESGAITSSEGTANFVEIEGFVLTDQADSFDGFNSSADLSVDAGAGDDTLTGGNANNTLLGGDGDDLFNIGYGSDNIVGGDGTDTLSIDQADDALNLNFTGDGQGTFNDDDGDSGVFSGIEAVVGSAGNDTINAAADTSGVSLSGMAGDDSLTGGSGNDTLVAGLGSDTLSGGDGDDLLIRGGTDVDDTLNELNGGAGNDTIRLEGGLNVDDQIDGGDGVDVLEILPDDNRDLTIDMVAGEAVDGATGQQQFSNIENITAGGGNDTIIGNGVDNVLTGGAGDDSIAAGGGNDTLLGGAGDDTLAGGAGADSMYGGTGLDILDYSASDGAVTVDLAANTASGGHATGDTINAVDGITGSAFDDSLTGFDSSGPDYTNVIDGGAGNDTIDGRGSDDTLIGGSGDDSIIGGTGDDFVTGGTGADTFDYSVGDGNDTISDFNIGNTGTLSDGDASNNDSIDLSGFYDNLHELYADQADDGVLNQSNTTDAKGRTVDYTDNSSFGSGSLKFTGGTGDNSFFTVENTGVVCFASGTRIRIPGGEVPIETLRRGDLVVTRDNGVKPILWIGSKELSQADLAAAPNLRPVRLAAGYFGLERDLIVSPQHGVLLRDRTGGGSEILYRACHLSEMGGGAARIMNGCRNVTYIHMLFEQHEAVFSNGIASESLYPGPMAYQSLDAPAQNELASLFPDLGKRQTIEAYGASARAYSCRQNLPKHLRDFRETC